MCADRMSQKNKNKNCVHNVFYQPCPKEKIKTESQVRYHTLDSNGIKKNCWECDRHQF